MILWRISNYADLHGTGGLRGSARWHTRGHPIVYLAETPSAAMLEILVHLEIDKDDLPTTYKLLRVMGDNTILFGTVEPATLPGDWKNQLPLTRGIGDEWLAKSETALLRVPSAIMPETWNWLLNPRHGDAACLRIASISTYGYDAHLFEK